MRLGKKYCDEANLLSELFEHGILRRVRTIDVEVRRWGPTKGKMFMVTLDASRPWVAEAKAEIARTQGTSEENQELYKLTGGGGAVCENADTELLSDEKTELEDGEVVKLEVKGMPLVWRTFDELYVTLSEGGALATRMVGGNEQILVTSGVELTEGRHYWEIGLVSQNKLSSINIGISKPNLDPNEDHAVGQSSNGWFICPQDGSLWGNGKFNDDTAGGYLQTDRVGVLLDLDDGSLRFFKNGVQHGPGYPAGSVKSPVVAAIQMYRADDGGRLLAGAHWPDGHEQDKLDA
jgi:hypothetical protein